MTLPHFARSLGETGLVTIDQRYAPDSGDVQEQGAEKDENEIADCG